MTNYRLGDDPLTKAILAGKLGKKIEEKKEEAPRQEPLNESTPSK